MSLNPCHVNGGIHPNPWGSIGGDYEGPTLLGTVRAWLNNSWVVLQERDPPPLLPFYVGTPGGDRIAPGEHVTMQASAVLRVVLLAEEDFLEVHTEADSSRQPRRGVNTAPLLGEGGPLSQPAQRQATWSLYLVTQRKNLPVSLHTPVTYGARRQVL